MKKLLIILFLAAGFAGVVGMLWPFETRLTDADIEHITVAVREQTTEPILSIRPLPRWKVHVMTGIDPGPLSGGGHDFYLRRGLGGWRISKGYLWIG